MPITQYFGIVGIVVEEDGQPLVYMFNSVDYFVSDFEFDVLDLKEFQPSYSDTEINSCLYWNIFQFLSYVDERLPNCNIVLSLLDIKNILEELDFILDLNDVKMKLDNLLYLNLITTIDKELWGDYVWGRRALIPTQFNILFESTDYDFYRITKYGNEEFLNKIDSFEHFTHVIKGFPILVGESEN
jgi:hypothetical protein